MDAAWGEIQDGETREQLSAYLRAWARHRVYFGMSCTPCSLERYGTVLTTACFHLGPQVPTPTPPMRRSTPERLRMSMVLAHESLVYRFPHCYEHRTRRGARNEHFLDVAMLCDHLCTILPPTAPQPDLLILPIEYVYTTERLPAAAFMEKLDGFLRALPPSYRYAVEVRNGEYLVPDYFAMLRRRGVAHVLSTCATMPSVLDQTQIPQVLTTNVAVVWAQFPVHAEMQLAITETVRRCVDEAATLYVYIDDSTERNSPLRAIAALMDVLNHDLARLSPIRNMAA